MEKTGLLFSHTDSHSTSFYAGVKSMYYKAALFVTVSPNKGQQMKLGTVAEKSKSKNSLVKDKRTQEHITVHKLRVAANVLI